MNHTYTNYLFVLYLHGEPISLNALLEQTEPAGDIGPGSLHTAKSLLGAMEKSGLIKITTTNEKQLFELTEYGKEVSAVAADIATAKLLREWQQKTMSSYAGSYSPSIEDDPLGRPA